MRDGYYRKKIDKSTRVGASATHLAQERLTQALARGTLLEAAIDRLKLGVILSDRTRRVWFCSREALRMAETGDAFGLRSKRVVARIRSEDERLAGLVRQAAPPVTDSELPSGGAMILSRRDSGAALQVVVSPLATSPDGNDRSSAIFIADASAPSTVDSDVIRAVLGLTPAEARVTVAYCDDLLPAEIGARLGLSKETVRWYLKQVYSKTGVSSQRKLVTRLHGIPAVWATDEGLVEERKS